MYVCVCAWLRLFVCTCACEDEEEEGGVWKKESYSEPLQSETCAAAKENCGRKSLLIEHEVCHLKLESSQTPETAAGRHLSGPYIKVPPGPGCVSPSHRGPFALAGGPFRLRARPHRGTSRRVRCAINAPALRSGVWAQVTAASPGRAVELGRRTGVIGGELPVAQAKAGTQRSRTKAQCGWI